MAFRTADYADEPDFPAATHGHGSQGASDAAVRQSKSKGTFCAN
jgi:hypothetical protein